MHFIRSVYYWASQGCPDAVPAGIIAVDLDNHFDLRADLKQLGYLLCTIGIFDDTCWQLGFTQEDVDLVRKDNGNMFQTLSNDQLIPTWQWDILKKDKRIKVSEHAFVEYLDFLDPEDRKQFQS